jgi:hypothetical protein
LHSPPFFPHSFLSLPKSKIFTGHLFFNLDYGTLSGYKFSAWKSNSNMKNVGLAYQSDKFFRLIHNGCGKQGRLA